MFYLKHPSQWTFSVLGLFFGYVALAVMPCGAGLLSGTFTPVPQGSNVNLTVTGTLDWVHWGLFTETSLNRKAGVLGQISDFTVVDSSNGFAYVWQYADNFNGYSWTDGEPEARVDYTTTGVWAYGTPQIDVGGAAPVPVTLTNPRMRDDAFEFSFLSRSNRTYTVLENQQLGGGMWEPRGTVNGTGGWVTVTNQWQVNSNGFFRVRSE